MGLARAIGHAQWQAFGSLILGMLYTDIMAFDEARVFLRQGLSAAEKGHQFFVPLLVTELVAALMIFSCVASAAS